MTITPYIDSSGFLGRGGGGGGGRVLSIHFAVTLAGLKNIVCNARTLL